MRRMRLMKSWLALTLFLLLNVSVGAADAQTNANAKPAYNVRAGTLTNVVVAADGSGQYKTVQEGIQAAATGSVSQPVVVHIKPGTYNELMYIQREKHFLRLVG